MTSEKAANTKQKARLVSTGSPLIAAVKATLVTLHLACSLFKEANNILIFFTSSVSVTESVTKLPAL